MTESGAESPSGADVIASIFPSELSANTIARERTGLVKFTDRERPTILVDVGDNTFPLGKAVLANQKYRQAQPCDLTVFF